MLDSNPLLKDFRNFLYVGWKFLRLPSPTDIQYDIAWYLQNGPRRKVIEAFRGIGKSWITSMYVDWSLLRDPQLNILVVSASKDRADNFSTFTQRLIREMPELASLKPRPGQRDSMVSFDVGPARASHAPSVTSKGVFSQLAGSRADILIADDIEIPNNSLTQMMRDKLSEAVREFDAILKPGGEIDYLGTPQTEMSLYNQLPSRGYSIRIWPSEYPDAARIGRDEERLSPSIIETIHLTPELVGRSTEPTRFPDIDLAERRASWGRAGYALQFLLDTRLSDLERYPLKLNDLIIMDLDTEVGPEKVIWASSPELVISDVPNIGLTNDQYHAPMGFSGGFVPYSGSLLFIDPAGRGADETAYAVVKILNSQLFVLDAGGLQGGYDDSVLEQLVTIAQTHKVNLVQYESNFGDGMFGRLLQPHLNKRYPCRVEEIKHSKQKELRIIDTLEPVMMQHRLVVNKSIIRKDYDSAQGYPTEKQSQYMLFHQMTRITRERHALMHDDRLDALAGAVAYWIEQMSRDIDQAVSDEREAALLRDLESFMGHVGKDADRKSQWAADR
jgi:hypothetical protein